jgi:hypothetical protein
MIILDLFQNDLRTSNSCGLQTKLGYRVSGIVSIVSIFSIIAIFSVSRTSRCKYQVLPGCIFSFSVRTSPKPIQQIDMDFMCVSAFT